MDPFRQGSGGYNQSSSFSYMGNLYDQGTYVEEPFNQGPRYDFQGNQRNLYQQNIDSDRNMAPMSSQINDPLGYGRYIPSNFSPPSERFSYALGSSQNLNRQTNFERTLQPSFSSQGETDARVRDSRHFVDEEINNSNNTNYKRQEYDNSSNLDNGMSYRYTLQDSSGKDANEASECFEQQPVEIDVNQAFSPMKSSDHSKEQIESAVDLSKPSNAVDDVRDEKVPESHEKELVAVKQESNEDFEIPEGESDTDDTIIEEPKKKKKAVKKQKSKSEKQKTKSEKQKAKPKEPKVKTEEIYKCTECDKVYSSQSSFRKHQNFHAGLFKCKICNKSWNSNYSLMQHEKSHTGEKEGNLCGICGKTFSDTSSLNKHHKSVHEKLTHFSCDKCDLKFYARKTFDEHMRVHTGERPFKCKICPKTYKRVSDLNHHVRGHTGETKHVCELCGKGVRRLSELKIHMNAHRQKGELLSPPSVRIPNVDCNVCGEMFHSQGDLDKHTKEHCKERDVMEHGLDRSEHDSMLIAAAIGSEMHEPGHKQTLSEKDFYYEQMRKLYRHATVRPESTQGFRYGPQMPISDASFHKYFPLPSKENNQKIDEKGSKQVSPEKPAENWLNNHYNSEQEKQKLAGSDNSVRRENEHTQTNQCEVQKKHISTPPRSADITESVNANRSSKPVVNESEINRSKSLNTTGENKEDHVKSEFASKQKSITSLVDKLAEQKSKDIANSENEDYVEIKMEHSDGDDTDDYEFEVNEQVEENIEVKPAKKKQSLKGKQRKNAKKSTTDTKMKPKTTVKRQRKRKPKRILKTDLTFEQDEMNEKDDLDEKIKSEIDAENEELNEAVNSALKDGLYLCTECDKTFQTRAAFKNHKLMHKGLYTCTQCNRSLSSTWSLQQHMLTHTNGEGRAKFPCDVCGKSFCDKSSVNKHVRAVHMNYKPFKCDQCDLTFSERKTMREHMRVHTGERPFLCAHCPKSFKRVSELNHHIKGHTGETKHTCDICGRGFRRQSELLRHVTLHTDERPHNCPVCGKDFRSWSSMHEHTQRHYGHTGKHICPHCGKRFFKRLKLERHLMSKKYCTNKCRYCLLEINNPEERQRHEANHAQNDGAMRFVCTICDKRFRAKGHLNKHARIHSGEKPYVCEECGAAFIQSNHLKQHMRKHTGERPYHCLICAKKFSQSGTLYSHMKTHMSDNPQEMNKHMPIFKEMGIPMGVQQGRIPTGLQQGGYDSEESDNDMKVFGYQDMVSMIGTSVA